MAEAAAAGGDVDAAGELAERGWTFHSGSGQVFVRLSGVALSQEAVTRSVLPRLARLLERDCRDGAGPGGGSAPEEETSPAAQLRKAHVDLSGTGLTDGALRAFLEGWCQLGLGRCAACFMLQRNRLTDASLVVLGNFAASEATGTLEELHASHQSGPLPLSRSAVLDLLTRLAASPKYPIWAKRRKAFRPVHFRLNNCGVEDPEAIALEMEDLTGARVCFADDQACIRTACKHARGGSGGGGCPVAHLFDFRSQERPIAPEAPREPAAALEAALKSSAAAEGEGGIRRGKVFLCGSCQRELPIDMFTRSQFQKATKMDEAAIGSSDPSHLVRRCNDCVMQPCCVCRVALPLTAFAGTQMLRPPGTRRCRPCAAETWLCVRCSQAKAKSEFSSVEARKGKRVAKFCMACEGSNPYFERRHVVCMAFSGRYAGAPAWVPGLAREVILRILAFAHEARFVKVSRAGFECLLCAKSWSFLTSGDDAPIERHLRTSRLHGRRLSSVEAGNLVQVASTGLDESRFRDGLGVRGAFCGREQVAEARALVDLERLLAAEPGLRPALAEVAAAGGGGGSGEPRRWVTGAEVGEARARLAARANAAAAADAPATTMAAAAAAAAGAVARAGTGTGTGHEEEEEEGVRGAGQQQQRQQQQQQWREERRAARKLGMLCSAAGGAAAGERAPHAGGAGAGTAAAADDDGDYLVDSGELAALRRFLAAAAAG